ncbi:MAG: nuclear transport factor 2 family protein [Bryobacteraceae bacterium]
MLSCEDVLLAVYRGFNTRDIESVLAAMHPDVDWPNGWEGGRVHGRKAVREYWTRQWSVINPHVEPLRFHTDDSNRTFVDVHAVVRDRDGNIIADEIIQHIYVIEDGLIQSMEIRKPEVSFSGGSLKSN